MSRAKLHHDTATLFLLFQTATFTSTSIFICREQGRTLQNIKVNILQKLKLNKKNTDAKKPNAKKTTDIGTVFPNSTSTDDTLDHHQVNEGFI